VRQVHHLIPVVTSPGGGPAPRRQAAWLLNRCLIGAAKRIDPTLTIPEGSSQRGVSAETISEGGPQWEAIPEGGSQWEAIPDPDAVKDLDDLDAVNNLYAVNDPAVKAAAVKAAAVKDASVKGPAVKDPDEQDGSPSDEEPEHLKGEGALSTTTPGMPVAVNPFLCRLAQLQLLFNTSRGRGPSLLLPQVRMNPLLYYPRCAPSRYSDEPRVNPNPNPSDEEPEHLKGEGALSSTTPGMPLVVNDDTFTPTKHLTPPPHHSSRPAAAHTDTETPLQ